MTVKHLLVILFSLLLLVGNIGVHVFEHFCKKDGDSISFFVKSDHDCHEKEVVKKESCCKHGDEQKKDDDCCTDETKVIHLDSDYSYSSDDSETTQLYIASVAWLNTFGVKKLNEKSSKGIEIQRPPPKSGRDILILKQVFII